MVQCQDTGFVGLRFQVQFLAFPLKVIAFGQSSEAVHLAGGTFALLYQGEAKATFLCNGSSTIHLLKLLTVNI